MPFTIFDPNMNKIDYPVGVTPLDFLVSAIEKERYIETVNGIPGNVNYGFDYKEREVTLNFWLRHYHGEHDQKLLKSELYAMLDSQPYFYVSDDRLPTRVLKLTVDESYLPDRINGSNIFTLEIKGQIIGLPFWQSRFTTHHIQQYKYNANNELFGLGDNIHLDYLDYSFKIYEFDIWNGGNVDLDPRDMYIKYTLNNVTTNGNLTIENVTTGEKFVFKESLVNQTLYINQTKVNVGVVNRLRDSNRKFPTIKKGLNHFKISNCTYSSIDIDFRYLWK